MAPLCHSLRSVDCETSIWERGKPKEKVSAELRKVAVLMEASERRIETEMELMLEEEVRDFVVGEVCRCGTLEDGRV